MKPYYQDNAVTIYHGDAYEIVNQVGNVDFVLTDPPYEMTATGGGIGAKRKYLADIDGFTDGGFDATILQRFDHWACFCSIAQVQKLIEIASCRRWMLGTWNKPNPTPLVNGNYLPDTEYIIHSFPSGSLQGDYKHRARFIVHPAHQHNLHPNEKPVAVVSKWVCLGSSVGQVILDPFAGSGTTGWAAKNLHRKAVLIEREEQYCEIAAKRMAQEVLALD